VTFAGSLESLAASHRRIEFQLKSHGVIAPTRRLRCSLHYPTFRDGIPDLPAFCRALRHELKRFCLPRARLERTERLIAEHPDWRDELLAEDDDLARSLFIKAEKLLKRSGECGELLLYVILESLLGAPQIVSKMYLKTNDDIPVFGYDGVHAKIRHSDGSLILYVGESKIYDDFGKAVSAALGDVKKRNSDAMRKEIDVVKGHLDIQTPELRDRVLDLLDPYDRAPNRVDYHAILVGYSCDASITSSMPEAAEHIFVSKMVDEIKAVAATVQGEMALLQLGNLNVEFFAVPFTSVSDLRKEFYRSIGWAALPE
jgi:Cap4 SAVED domain